MNRSLRRYLIKYIEKKPTLYHIARKVYMLLSLRYRFVLLSGNTLPNAHLDGLENSERYNGIVDDLVAYTGFSHDKLSRYILRHRKNHFESEFNWFAPKDEQELSWFYRCSSAYLFANAIHPYISSLDIIKDGKVLDYGAGAGCNTIGLAKRGIKVDFLEICRLQADFIKFRAKRHSLNNIREIRPYHAGKFDPLSCLKGTYDAVLALDVLEHIPNYHLAVRQFVAILKPGGMILENSAFDQNADPIAIHLRPSIPLEAAMIGMERAGKGIWKKKQ
jgi:2-polyprenyl-3-methyl-5-hydroxy-6-metoxy-1,4-benzoquinol methylase